MSATIESLGECRLLSPLRHMIPGAAKFKIDSERIFRDDRSTDDAGSGPDLTPRLTFEVAGPRERIYFDPANTTAAVVTCGWLVSRPKRRYPAHRDGALARIPRDRHRRNPIRLRGTGTEAWPFAFEAQT